MKKLISSFLAVVMLFSLSACGKQKENIVFNAKQETVESSGSITQQESISHESSEHTVSSANPQEDNTGKTQGTDILVAYFSRTGNTKALAEYAVDYLNADIFEIEAAVPYTDADIAYYTDCRADREQTDPTVRPEIANQIPDIQQYDTIVLGYPIWHGQAPRIISTFLESYDFSGKTILPFCTSHSSGIGNSDKNLHALCDAQWMDGKRFAVNGDEQAFAEWLSNNVIRDEEDTMSKELTLMVNGTVIPVLWEDNTSVAELSGFVSDNPIRIAMRMYGGWEQVGSLGRSFSRKDVQLTADTGDIMLYSGNQIVLFFGENSWAYTKLGHIDLPADRVRDLLSAEAVTVTLCAK